MTASGAGAKLLGMSDTTTDAQKDEERKKGGVSFSLEQLESLQNTLQAASPVGVGAGVGAGGAAASAAGALGSKIAMLIVLSMLGAGAVNMARLNAPKPKLAAPRHDRPAEKPKYEGDLSNLPKSEAPVEHIQDVVIGNMTGKSAEQLAADAAAADAQAKAEAEADQKAKDSAAAASAAAPAAPTGPEANRPTVAGSKAPPAIPKPNSPFNSKFGGLSGVPGGGGGGAHASGGAPAAPPAGALARGAASTLSKGFGPSGPGAKSGGRAIGGGGKGGHAFGQLQAVNGFSRAGARASSAEGGANGADRGFSNGGNYGGSPIGVGGGGAGISGAGTHTGAAGGKTAQSGPIGSGMGEDGTKAAAPATASNATPWQTFVDIAKWALIIAGIMMLATFVLASMAKKTTPIGSGLMLAAQICAGIAVAAGAVAAACGIAVAAMGQTMQGLMFTAGGAVVSFLAYKQLTNEMDESSQAADKVTSTGNDPAAQAPGKGTLMAGPDGPTSSSWTYTPEQVTGYHISDFGADVTTSPATFTPTAAV